MSVSPGGLFDALVLPGDLIASSGFAGAEEVRRWESAFLDALDPHAAALTGYDDYFRIRTREWQVLRSLVPGCFDLARPHELALELGAGFGFKSALLSPYARRLVAVDIPVTYDGYLLGHQGSSMIAARSLVNERLGIGHVQFAEAWPDNLPVDDGSVSFVYSEYTLEHVPDIDAVARELARIVRPGGTMVHVIPTMLDAVEVFVRANIDVPVRDILRSIVRRVVRRSRIEYTLSVNGTVVPPWHSEFLGTYRDQLDVYRMERVVFPFLEVGFDLVQLTQTREHNRVLVLQRGGGRAAAPAGP